MDAIGPRGTRSDPAGRARVLRWRRRKVDTNGSTRTLRLVWSNPAPRPGSRPRARVDFALAIERHLTGADGLSREQFLALYSGRRTRLALAPAPDVS